MSADKRVLKWMFTISDDEQQIGTGRVIHSGTQSGILCVWTEEEDVETPATVTARVVGTGHGYSSDYEAVASVEQPPFVWHVVRQRVQP